VAPREPAVSWSAFILFYLAMLIVIIILDWINGLLALPYVGLQVGLLTVGVAVFAVVGWRMPNLTAEQGVLLAFTVGALTIIPAILMSLGRTFDFWPQYFLIASGMAAGSFLGFVFVRFASRITSRDDEALN
jgi:hypothetical protein